MIKGLEDFLIMKYDGQKIKESCESCIIKVQTVLNKPQNYEIRGVDEKYHWLCYAGA